jgi:putative transcriptional regulator
MSYKGKILISNSSIITDEFNKSVVFMIDHDSTGAFGLAVNKKSEFKITEIITGIPSIYSEVDLYWGGPVDKTFISILHDKIDYHEPGLKVINGVYLSRSFELLTELLSSNNSNFRIYQGYSGWSAGQLEQEFQRKSWVSHESKADFIFPNDPEKVWREALKSKGGIYKYFAEHTKDPLLN